MGGSAFKDPNFPLVRLTPEQYKHLCPLIVKLLSLHYAQVHIPPSAPSKPSEGDVDVLVFSSSSPRALPATMLSTYLGASAHHDQKHLRQFAVFLSVYSTPSLLAIPFPKGPDAGAETEVVANPHFQLDVRICTMPEMFEWFKIRYAYNSLFSLLGAMAKPYGLSLHETGLSLRIAEFEGTRYHKQSRVSLISMDADAIFRVLELDVEHYHRGFQTLEELFDWVTATPLFYRGTFAREQKSDDEANDSTSANIKDIDESNDTPETEQDEGEPRDYDGIGVPNLKARDRKRNARWMERQFHTVYLPSHPSRGVKTAANHATQRRPEFAQRLVDQFGKREKYEKTIRTFREQVALDEMWRTVAGAVGREGKEGKELGDVMKGLKGWWKIKGKEEVGIEKGAEVMVEGWEGILEGERERKTEASAEWRKREADKGDSEGRKEIEVKETE